jgi:hypothetical protein
MYTRLAVIKSDLMSESKPDAIKVSNIWRDI